jgi:hypothetical protein
MYRVLRVLILIVLASTLFACNGDTPTTEPFTPSSGQTNRDTAWVDWDYSEILVMESYPMQVSVIVKGDIPSPCHDIEWEVAEPNEDNEIHVTLWSFRASGVSCAALLEPFEEQVPIGDFSEGGYSVWVNEGKVGDF